MSRSTSAGSTSLDLSTGKKFIKKLLYVQYVDKRKDMVSEIPDRYLEEYLLADRTNFHDSKFTKYLKSPKENLSIFKSSMRDWIWKVAVYSNPLPIPLQLHDVTIHAFVVFQTIGRSGYIWWSLEKNGHHIVLQQSENEDDVINKIYDTETKTSVERLGPIQKSKKKKWKMGERGLDFRDLMRIIVDTNKISEPYHLVTSNCQHFTSSIIKELKQRQKWSAPTSAVEVFKFKKKKIQPKIQVDAFKYKSILKDGKFDFYRAMMEGRRKDFEKLLKTNDFTIECLNDVDSQGYTLLEWATVFSTSDWPIDEFLKEKGAQNPSDEKLFKQNVFFIALQYLPPNQKSKLLSFDGIDVNSVNPTGDTSLHLALYGGKWELAEEILNRFEDYDVNITNSVGDTPLLLVARLKCEIGLFQQILKRTNSENVNKADRYGNTALHYAMLKKSETEVEELLKREDVDVDITNKDHSIALHLASKWTNIQMELFYLILEKTTDTNAQDNNGWTALHCAIIMKSETAIKALLAHNDVDVNVKTNHKDTALHFASMFWEDMPSDLFKLILERSTDVINAQDKDGGTALHFAILFKSEIATKELLAHKDVKVHIKNNRNETALSYASMWKDIPMDLFKLISERSTDEVEKILKMDGLSKYLRNLTVHK
jgi:ankyrin repeat protein